MFSCLELKSVETSSINAPIINICKENCQHFSYVYVSATVECFASFHKLIVINYPIAIKQ